MSHPSVSPIPHRFIVFFVLAIIGGLVGFIASAFGQDVAPILPVAPVATDAVSETINRFAQKAPWLLTIVSVMGACRVLIKPFFSFLHAVVMVTPSDRDDQWLARAENHKVFKYVLFGLDYVFSIKLVHPQANPPMTLPKP